jgi:quercetin 2,3-dioxygenase
MCEPRYQDIIAKNIPTKSVNGVTVQVIAGESMGLSAPTQTYTPMHYLEFKLEKNASFTQQVPAGWTTFIFVLDGMGVFGEKRPVEAKAENALILSDDGDSIQFKNENSDLLRLLLISGQPIKEPIVHGGAFVMNTQQEIEQAHHDLHNFQNGFERARTWKSEELKKRLGRR